jgi:uncharacterized protein YjbI with pentapeptide repeats
VLHASSSNLDPAIAAAWIAAAVGLLTLLGSMAIQAFGIRRVSRDTTTIVQEQLGVQREQLDKTLTEERRRTLNERFATAADRLGTDRPAAVRLAGVYAMAGLADDWRENRQTCIDVLFGYLRLPYSLDPGEEGEEAARTEFRADREVRHTVIRVIASHLQPDALVSWCGLDLDFTGARFDGGAFSGAIFDGASVSFERTEFAGGTVLFVGARFVGGQISFDRAQFTRGTVSFVDTEFTGASVTFILTEFAGGEVLFEEASFAGGEVVFGGAKFTGAAVTFGSAKFTGGVISFDRAQFSRTPPDFSGAEFTGSTVTFDFANFAGGEVLFDGASFAGGEVRFGGAQLTGGGFSFENAKFAGGIVGLRRDGIHPRHGPSSPDEVD